MESCGNPRPEGPQISFLGCKLPLQKIVQQQDVWNREGINRAVQTVTDLKAEGLCCCRTWDSFHWSQGEMRPVITSPCVQTFQKLCARLSNKPPGGRNGTVLHQFVITAPTTSHDLNPGEVFWVFFPPTSLIYWTKRWCSLHLSWDITVSLECDEVRHLCDLRRPCSRPLKFSTGLSLRK